MRYRFRLRIAAKQAGKFNYEAAELTVPVSADTALKFAARNADSLARATAFHFEGGGYETEVSARSAGERLRVRLRLLNAVLSLGIHIPAGDRTSGSVSEELKRKLLKEHDGVLFDGVWGLTTFPDDDRHFECVVGGNLTVRPSDPSYVFEALKSLWTLDVTLDEPSEDALSIIGLATLESSEKAAFLTSYLALEQLIECAPRSNQTVQLIERFQKQARKTAKRKRQPIPTKEAQSLCTALGMLRTESFTNALMRFADRLASPAKIKGRAPRAFLSVCVEARNRIAHHGGSDFSVPLPELTDGLRELVLTLIWTRNQLSSIAIDTPPSAISVADDGIKIRIL
jgi:hypothetical protein